ncbi:hypothetical protein HMPREF1598_00063 [Escherichia coli 907710]|nr:hypothetical protein HMPREF1598_00063 [Escherichia coli 907710]
MVTINSACLTLAVPCRQCSSFSPVISLTTRISRTFRLTSINCDGHYDPAQKPLRVENRSDKLNLPCEELPSL